MKIQGPHPSINTYKQLQQHHTTKKQGHQKDQLNISDAAKKMQQTKSSDTKRAGYVNEIKTLVQSGEYKVDPEKIAGKMIDYWS